MRFGFACRAAHVRRLAAAPHAAPQEGAVRDGDGVDYSTTNVQEEGVDEPDIVKTDGKRLYVMAGSTLHVFDIRSGEPKLVGSLTLKGFGHQLLVSGDRVLALTTYWDDPVLQPQPQPAQFAPEPYPQPSSPRRACSRSTSRTRRSRSS